MWQVPDSASVRLLFSYSIAGPFKESLLVLYGFGIAYLIAPGVFDSTHIVQAVASLPESVKVAGKAILAAPFVFHSLNGVRHLGWDLIKCAFLLQLLIAVYLFSQSSPSRAPTVLAMPSWPVPQSVPLS